MTEIIFKLSVLATVSTGMVAFIALMPSAQPLPEPISEGITWLLTKMYFINAVFPVDVFFDVVGYSIEAFFWYFALRLMMKVMLWVFRVA